jgi:DNA-binding response OmpR family regulator
MREQLRLAGFATDITYTQAAALARAKDYSYAAILVDLQLPDGDGIGLILRLRAQAQHHDTPIIVVSVDPGRGREDARSSKLNVLGWLSKPVDFEHLVQVLRARTASSQRPLILHVDDDHDVLAVVADALRTVADVVSVDSLESARRALAINRIDLVVLDVVLGADSGLELLPALRDGQSDAIPVIIFSAQGAGLACDEQIQVALSKSQASLASLSTAIHDRLAHRLAHESTEAA